MANSTLRGVFAPILTPVHDDLSIDVPRWIALGRDLLAGGCHGLCPFGTTGEANSFTVDERMDALEQLVEAGIPVAQLMPGTGMCALPDSVRLSAHAAALGCGGVLLLPPFYYKGVSDEGIYRNVAEVIERVGDARLRIYLYHIPPVAVVSYSLSLIERLVRDYPTVVVGIKDSSGDWDNLHAILTNFPGFGTFTGSERFLLALLRLGGAGTINGVANVIAGAERELWEGWESAHAADLQARVDQMRPVFQNVPVIPAIKAIVAHERQDPAWRMLRPPHLPLETADAAAVLERWSALGMTTVKA